MGMRYDVFIRRFWKDNPKWHNGLEPRLGRKTYLRKGVSESEARRICKDYNDSHDPGRYSLKAEYKSQ